MTNTAVTPAGAREFSRAILHAWTAGDLSDVAVRELTATAMGAITDHAVTPLPAPTTFGAADPRGE